MQIHLKLVAVAVILVASAESKPAWPNLYVSNYEEYKEPSEVVSWYRQAINQPQVLQYQETYTPYQFYNVHTDIDTVHPVVASEKTTISHFPAYSIYLGTPVYNIGIPSPSVPRAKKPPQEGREEEKPDKDKEDKETPQTTTTTTTEEPSENTDNSTVERLDTKLEAKMDEKKPCLTSEDTKKDSVTVEAL